LKTCRIKTHALRKRLHTSHDPSSCTHDLQSKESEEVKTGERMVEKTMCGTGEIVAKAALLFQNFDFPH
jgi:hypothetical protein